MFSVTTFANTLPLFKQRSWVTLLTCSVRPQWATVTPLSWRCTETALLRRATQPTSEHTVRFSLPVCHVNMEPIAALLWVRTTVFSDIRELIEGKSKLPVLITKIQRVTAIPSATTPTTPSILILSTRSVKVWSSLTSLSPFAKENRSAILR